MKSLTQDINPNLNLDLLSRVREIIHLLFMSVIYVQLLVVFLSHRHNMLDPPQIVCAIEHWDICCGF